MHLFSLHHFLIEIVRESALWIELSGPLSTHEHTVLAHQTSSADRDQRDTVTAQPLIEIEVSALHLSAHRDCPAQIRLTPVSLFCTESVIKWSASSETQLLY